MKRGATVRTAIVLTSLACFVGDAKAQDADATAVNMLSMGQTLQWQPSRPDVDLGAMGQWQIFGVASAGAVSQSNPPPGSAAGMAGFSNAQVIVQKSTGFVQFFAQAGLYAIPALGVPLERAVDQTTGSWGYLPHAWLALAPDDNWSVMVGKIPAMGGYESTFTYQNVNIQRGLLYNQTSSVSRGVQVNYADGPFSASVALTDGSYSNVYNWLGASVSLDVDETSTFTLGWTGSLSGNPTDTQTTPLLQNNSQIANLIYAYAGSQWSLAPYVQYTYVPANPAIGIQGATSTLGAALLATYHVTPLEPGHPAPRRHISIPMRFEYIGSSGNAHASAANLLYGAGSAAWSATITPTFHDGPFFVRAEVSYMQAMNITPGTAFGASGTRTDQARVMLEAGILY